jgi:hypothetical protein
MKRVVVLAFAAVMAVAAVATAVGMGDQNFGTHLKGRYEVPVRDSNGQGQATFRVSDDGQSVDYKLNAANIDNAFMAHIHIGPPDAAGPIGVWLAPSTTPGVTLPLGGGRFDGVFAEGTFTAANFVGPLAGKPMSALLDAIAAGNAYVNIHTNDGVAPTNTGPGDFPGGEIRGQLGD